MSLQNAEISQPASRLLSEGSRLSAFLSYADQTVRSDQESTNPIGRLFQELSLRGFDTFRDVSSMRDGEFNEPVILDRLARSDAYVPVVDRHFLESDFCLKEFALAISPAMRRRGLIVVPIFVGFGDARDEVEAAIWPALHYSVKAHWTGLVGSELTEALTAKAALTALSRTLPAGLGPTEGTLDLSLVTRGTVGGTGLVIDATGVFNECAVAVGSEEDWKLLYAAMRDVERVLREHTVVRSIRTTVQSHLAAAVMLGFVFRENAGWRVTVATGDGDVMRSPLTHGSVVEPDFEPGLFSGSGGVIAAGVDLAQRDIVPGVYSSYKAAPRGFIWAIADGDGSLYDGAVISPSANAVAHALRKAADEHQVDSIDLFLCTPATFAVFLGTRFGSIGRPITLQDWDKTAHIYKPVFELTEADSK